MEHAAKIDVLLVKIFVPTKGEVTTAQMPLFSWDLVQIAVDECSARVTTKARRSAGMFGDALREASAHLW